MHNKHDTTTVQARHPATVAAYAAALPTNPDDIVEAILRACLDLAPQFSAAVAAAVDVRIRAEWGAENAYIPQELGGASARTHERNRAICRDHQRGERTALLARRYNLSRRRIEQIVASSHSTPAKPVA
jgi:Mor family transcriptional regulator